MKQLYLVLLVATLFVNPVFGQNPEYIEVNPLAGNTANFPQFGDSDSDFSDIDGDGDLDLLISGTVHAVGLQTKLYKNIGGGKFLLVPNTTFISPILPKVDFGDVNGDGDEDLLITSDDVAPALYENDGFGNFTLSATLSSELSNAWGEGSFIDINGDAFMDVVIAGWNSTLYFNNNGNFVYLNSLGAASGCKMGDMNNDGKSDIFLLNSNSPVCINDGAGNFTVTSTSFDNISVPDVAFNDMNNDQMLDIIVLGSQASVYLNNGNLNFSQVTAYNIPITTGEVYCFDMDSDGKKDVLIRGYVGSGESVIYAYKNTGTSTLQEFDSIPFADGRGHVSIGDIDNDGDEDVLVSGQQFLSSGGFGPNAAKLYKNLYFNQLSVSTFSSPSNPNDCNGYVLIAANGIPDFTFELSNGTTIAGSESTYIDSLCPGIYSVLTTDGNNDTITSTFVIPSDSNYIFINPFDDFTPADSIGITIENCDIDYNTIDTIYIDSYQFYSLDSVVVNWAVIDTNGTHIIPSLFVMNYGFGNYWLQLSLYCTQKSVGNYFVVTEGISYTNGHISLLELGENDMNSIVLFPNPTRDNVIIYGNQTETLLTVYDLQGKVIKPTYRLDKEQESLSLKEFQNGMYIFEFSTNKGKTIKRIVKN